MDKLKIGLFGLGHLGKIHLKCLEQTPFILVGFYDSDINVRNNYKGEIKVYDSEEALLEVVDAVDIVCPTIGHYDLAMKSIKAGKHVFVEKPICYELEQAKLIKSALIPELVFQVGHVERFNPAFIPLKGRQIKPMFIEGHRIAKFNPRGTDVSVVLDLMIHDLDIICALVDSEVDTISASGVSIVSNSPDIANARIEFQNGCVANLTASRISMKQMRKLRLFANNSYVSVDFLEKELSIIRIEEGKGIDIESGFELETDSGKKYVNLEQPEIHDNNAIREELNAFYNSIANKKKVEVGIDEAIKSLDIALEIIKQISAKEKKYIDTAI